MNRILSRLSGPRRLAVVALVLGALLTALPASADDAAITPPDHPGRLLVVSLPGLTWSDVRHQNLPNMEEFLSDAAMADLATRGVLPRSGPGDAYLTMSAGTRATTEEGTDGQVLAVGEQSTGSAAGEIYRRRTGNAPSGPFVSLTWPSLIRANLAKPYDAKPGLLSESLADAGITSAVIGNADGTDAIGPSYERQVGLAVADQDGVVPGGDLGKGLLESDPSAPFGKRLDPRRVVEEFHQAWKDARPSGDRNGGVVVVEGSDLARTLRYRPIVDYSRYKEMMSEAFASSDALLGSLLQSVDYSRDTVMVVAPYNRRGDRDLTAVALRGPRTQQGYLQSASTQRPGYLTLVDIAPTILDQLGVPRPEAMEGRPAEVTRSQASVRHRVAHLVKLNTQSRFRENLLTPTTTAIVVSFAVLIGLAILAHANRWQDRARAAIRFGTLVTLGLMPASYLARLFPIEREGVNFYWAFIVIAALAAAALATFAGNRWRRPRLALVLLLGLMAVVLVVDVVTGSKLSINAAFGYSPTGNSRLYGISNYSYGQLAAAACLLAAMLADVRPDRRGRGGAIAIMVATLVVLAVPTWGGDVGGTLAFTPAVVVFVALLARRRIRLRTVAMAVLGTAIAILASGFLDLARPPSQRSHLGRLFERTGNEGLTPLLDLIERKFAANLEVSSSSLWVLAIPLGITLWGFLRYYPDHPYAAIKARYGTLGVALGTALVAGVLGSALNDSGAIIGGVMAAVVGLALISLLLEGPPVADVDETIGAGHGAAEVACDPVIEPATAGASQ